MRLPNQVTKCVGFVCETTHVDSTGIYGDAYATGFFIAVPCESEQLREQRMMYFVTARHVATDMKDRFVHFLVNKINGGTVDLNSPDTQWWLHPTDPAADVAIVQVAQHSSADIVPVAVETIGIPSRLTSLNIGIGDEIYATGLFTEVPGTTRNEAIVRHGNIAMLPQEPIQTELGFTDVYLVEARSLGGLSGSPVFVRPTYSQRMKSSDGKKECWSFSVGAGETLLGLMHGHWDIKESEMNKPYFTHDRKHGVNYGIAIVVPAQKIYETIYQSALVERRRNLEEGILTKNVPGMDSAKERQKEAQTFTQKDFNEAMRRVSRKVK